MGRIRQRVVRLENLEYIPADAAVITTAPDATLPNASVLQPGAGTVVTLGAGTVQVGIAAGGVSYANIQAASGNTVIARAAATAGTVGEVALSAATLLGRGSSGDIAPITLGTNLAMSGTTLSASSGISEQFIYAFAGSTSTQTDSTNKRVVGEFYFDPTDTALGTSGTSTATLEVTISTSSAGNTVNCDLIRLTGSGSPTVVGTVTPSASTTSVLATATVSTAFRPTGTAGIFAVRIWLTTNNGIDYATCTSARVRLVP